MKGNFAASDDVYFLVLVDSHYLDKNRKALVGAIRDLSFNYSLTQGVSKMLVSSLGLI